jgi:CheY-like chemotaxis protein
MKLLIGDDDAASNREIVKLVQAAGHEAVSAATGDEVVKLLSTAGGRPNFAILNSATQNLHGLDICKKFRATPALYYTYFVLMNGNASQEEIMVLLEGGADDYLTKPVNPEDLAVRLKAGQRVLQNEEKLTKITQEWKTMLDNLPFGIACLSSDGELRRANRPFFDLMGYRDMKAVLNKKLGDTVVRFPSDFDELITNIKAAHPFDRVEMDFVKRDSSILKLCVWGRPISLNGVVFELITSLA